MSSTPSPSAEDAPQPDPASSAALPGGTATLPTATPAQPPAPARRSPAATALRALALLLLLGAVWWSFNGIGFRFDNLKRGFEAAGSYLSQMVPHNASERADYLQALRGEWPSLVQTLQMAIVGTVAAALLAFPVSFFAARTTSLFRPLSSAIKGLLNVGRSVPILVYAVLVVAAFGLGAPAGAIAIYIGAFVMLAKLYAEGLESIAPGPVEAVKASGGNAIQTFIFGMLPQVFPNYLSSTLYAFELNIGASAVLGIVGAGGLGNDLLNYMHLFQMLQIGAILLMLVVLVNVVDYVSYQIRQMFS